MTPTDLATLREKAAVDFAQNRTSAAPLVRSIRMAMRHGCGDHSCEFVKPTGMATNGGCRCWSHLESAFYAVRRSLLSTLEAEQQQRARLEQERDELLRLALHMDMCRECGDTADFRCSDVTDEQRALVKRLAELARLSGDDR